MSTRHSPRCAKIVRVLALIDESLGEAARQLLGRPLDIIRVVTGILVCQQYMQHIVPIVIPLRIDILLQMGGIVMVLQYQMHMPSRFYRGADSGGHLVNPVLLLDRVYRIETQAIEAI